MFCWKKIDGLVEEDGSVSLACKRCGQQHVYRLYPEYVEYVKGQKITFSCPDMPYGKKFYQARVEMKLRRSEE